MSRSLEVLFTPADFSALKRRNLDDTLCVVFDVFRATSSMVNALANGARAIVPVSEISEALAVRGRDPAALLAGERDGLRIRADLAGVDFDFGNSPGEFTRDRVLGKTIAMTTTNGSRALVACAHARRVLVGSFLNLKATADHAARDGGGLIVVCGGTFDQAAFEDVLAAGALCDALWSGFAAGEVSDAALMARKLYAMAAGGLAEAAAEARNGRRLLDRPELRADVPFCLQRDLFSFAAVLNEDGTVTREPSTTPPAAGSNPERFEAAIRRFDEENARDPNSEIDGGQTHPREWIYARWLTGWVLKLDPQASEELRLAAHCQHLCRWMIPRQSYPMTRAGYLQWRQALKEFHAQRAGEILREAGYPDPVVQRVQHLNLKRDLPRDPDTRVLEDALCLVFLERQLAALAAKTDEGKVVNAIRKSWAKMSPAGQAEALKLPYGAREKALVERALRP